MKFLTAIVFSGLALSSGLLFGQDHFDNELRLTLEPAGSSLTARVVLHSGNGDIQALSLAICNSTADVVLEDVQEGAAILTAKGGGPADYIGLRSDSLGGFVTLGMLVDFSGGAVLGIGDHEILVLSYALRPGGTGGSIRFCVAGDPPVEASVVRYGGSSPLLTSIAGKLVSAASGVEGATGGTAVVPISLTSEEAGFTGGTFILCHDPAILDFEGVEAPPGLANFSPVLSTPVQTASGFQVTLTLGTGISKASGLPVLLPRYRVKGSLGQASPIAFCQEGAARTLIRFGDVSYQPQAVGGSVNVTSERVPPTFSITDVEVGMQDDPVPVTVESVLSIPEGGGIQGFQVVLSFDAGDFEVVDEGSAEGHRGDDLAAFLSGKTPVSETRTILSGSFEYAVAFDVPLTRTDAPSYPAFSLAKLRLARKTASLPGGGEGKRSGFVDALMLTPGSNNYTLAGSPPEAISPRLQDGFVTVGTMGSRFKVSSVEIEIFQLADVTVSLDSPLAGIVSLAYHVRHDPAKLSIFSLQAAPELLAMNPDLSTFTQAGDSFQHEVVFDPSSTLGPVEGFPLSRVEYKSTGGIGESFPVEVVAQGAPMRSSIAVSLENSLYDIVPGTIPGEVRLKEDPKVLAYRASSGRAPPGSLFVASILIDAAVGGIPSFQGTMAHDPSMADVKPSYIGFKKSTQLGSALKTIKNGGPPDYWIVNPASGPNGEHGVLFAASFSLTTEVWLPPGLGLEVFRVGYNLKGRYGDIMPLRFAVMSFGAEYNPEAPLIENIVTRDIWSVPVANLIPGQVILTDPLATSISAASTPRTLQAVAVTEFGWRWGLPWGSPSARHYDASGSAFGTDVDLPGVSRRIASGGEGWALVSLPGEVAILRFDRLERRVALPGEPYGIAADRERNFWVAVAGDRKGSLVRISRDGRILRSVALEARAPRELAIDEEGAIWVACDGYDSLSRVAADGALIRPVAARLRSSQPAGLASDGRGTIWASDAGDLSLLAFDLQGRELRRIPLEAEPTDISLDGAGDLWTVLKGLAGRDQLVRIQLGPDPAQVIPVQDSSTYHGDRTGLHALRILLPEEDSDQDGIANLLEIRDGTDPLDSADPPEPERVQPVRKLAAKATSIHIASPSGGGQTGTENVAGLTWENPTDYTLHIISVDGRPMAGDVSGGATSASLEDLPPGPSTVTVQSFVGGDGSPEISTSILFGPGTSVRSVTIAEVEPYGIAFDPAHEELYVLDGKKNQVMVLDDDFQFMRMIPIPLPLGDPTVVLSGIACDAAGNGGAGSLLVLDGAGGRYQEMTLDGSLIGDVVEVPLAPREGIFFSDLKSGRFQGNPALFSIARGPQNDDIIVFSRTGGGGASRISHPLSGDARMHFNLGGISFRPGSPGEADRLWISTGLEGEAIPRLVLELPLDGSPSQGRVLMNVFDWPEGIPQVRGIDISPVKGDLFVATSDRRYHLLSDFGIVRGAEGTPQIERIMTGEIEAALGPVAGRTEVAVEGRNFGTEMKDLRVIIGKSTAESLRLERSGELDRLTVLSPPSDGPGPVPIFLFRTQALDFRQSGFYYCDLPAGSGPDCNSDGIPDACQIQWSDCDKDGVLDSCQLQQGDCDKDGVLDSCQLAGRDCNSNGVLDTCDIAFGTSKDIDQNGLPDDCIPFLRGDPNDDGSRNITDAIVILGFLFLGNPATLGCMRSADLSDEGDVNISDVILLLSHLYLGTETLPAPFPGCGPDWTEDTLSCETFESCETKP